VYKLTIDAIYLLWHIPVFYELVWNMKIMLQSIFFNLFN